MDVTRCSGGERGGNFLKLHFVAPERSYTGISTPTARDNEEASVEAPLRGGERDTPVGPTSQRAAHGDIIDIREEQKGRAVTLALGGREERKKLPQRVRAGVVGGDTKRKRTRDHHDRAGITDLPKPRQRPPKCRQNMSLSLSLSLPLAPICFVANRFPPASPSSLSLALCLSR